MYSINTIYIYKYINLYLTKIGIYYIHSYLLVYLDFLIYYTNSSPYNRSK